MSIPRHAARALAQTPVFTTVTVLSLGVAIGMATSIFSVARALYFAPLPWEAPDRLVELWQTEKAGSARPSDYLQPERMLEWAGMETRTLRDIAGRGLAAPLVLAGAEGPERVDVEPLVGDWFATLGVRADRGRILSAGDALPGAEPAAVVSHALWRNRLGSDPDVLGRVLELSGTTVTVVGVAPRALTARAVVWVPAASLPELHRPVAYAGVGRLAEGATAEDAAREVERLAALQLAADSGRFGGLGATATPMGQMGRSGDQPTLWILGGVVGAVLLIGLSNLTTLFLVRAQERGPALAVRVALGAGPWRVGGGLAAEALIVGLGGSFLGLLLAVWGKELVRALAGGADAFGGEPALGAPAVALALALGVLVTVAVGLEPVRRLRHADMRSLLQQHGGTSAAPGERRTRNGLVALQVAASVMLVAVAWVVGSAYKAYRGIDVGYDSERLVVAFPDYELADVDGPEQWELARRVRARLEGRPEVSGVAMWRFVMQNYPPRPEFDAVIEGTRELTRFQRLGGYYAVEPGFFTTAGIARVSGRSFAASDDLTAPPVAVVTRGAASAWWPGQEPLGRQVRLGAQGEWMTVVGVVEDVGSLGRLGRTFLVNGRHLPLLFRPASQAVQEPEGWRAHNCANCDGAVVGARAAGPTPEAAAALRRGWATVAPDLPIRDLGSLFDRQVRYGGRRIVLAGRLVGAGSVAGLVLALLGIGGLVADGVARRTREIGIRLALGAGSGRIIGAMARESLACAMAGIGLGLVAIFALHGAVDKVLSYDVRRLGPDLLDPGVLGAAAAAVVILTLATALVTARRALRVEPAVALRSD